ncbi:hypothetical protein BDD12DRAFT_145485 [Trichophaea hybrida]|nr:hypothetical protein BDD12DRAFT_145485 [Trichophaea hybrida]
MRVERFLVLCITRCCRAPHHAVVTTGARTCHQLSLVVKCLRSSLFGCACGSPTFFPPGVPEHRPQNALRASRLEEEKRALQFAFLASLLPIHSYTNHLYSRAQTFLSLLASSHDERLGKRENHLLAGMESRNKAHYWIFQPTSTRLYSLILWSRWMCQKCHERVISVLFARCSATFHKLQESFNRRAVSFVNPITGSITRR